GKVGTESPQASAASAVVLKSDPPSAPAPDAAAAATPVPKSTADEGDAAIQRHCRLTVRAYI
uniref:hypothetical protein n=1 Tax=Thiohalocapsa sp. TaxID=2497641 RepID=UPI0025D60665